MKEKKRTEDRRAVKQAEAQGRRLGLSVVGGGEGRRRYFGMSLFTRVPLAPFY